MSTQGASARRCATRSAKCAVKRHDASIAANVTVEAAPSLARGAACRPRSRRLSRAPDRDGAQGAAPGAAAVAGARWRPAPASRSRSSASSNAGTEPERALETLGACGAALNVQLAAFVEAMPGREPAAGHRAPAAAEPRRRDGAGRRLDGDPGGDARSEGRWSRSIDVLLERAARREAAVVEIWDLLLDGGEAMRGLESKVQALRERLGPGVARARAARRARHAPEPERSCGSCATCSRATLPGVVRRVAPCADGSRHADAGRRRASPGPASTAPGWSRARL